MTNTALLNNIDHGDLKVVTRHAAEFGDSINQVLVFPTEFEEVQREYPILFQRDANGTFESVALLGLDRDENLFLGEQGWLGRYVPAMQRRGPFLIGLREQEVDGEVRREPMIHVDLDHPRVSRTEGQPVFLPHGGNSPYLEHVAQTLRVLHQGIEASGAMFAAFEQAELIQPVALNIQLDDVQRYELPDFFTIAQDRLADLGGAELERLNRAGFLRTAFLVAASLANVGRLIELKNRKRGAGPNG